MYNIFYLITSYFIPYHRIFTYCWYIFLNFFYIFIIYVAVNFLFQLIFFWGQLLHED